MELARAEWRIEDVEDGWTLSMRPPLSGMFWAHIIYAFGWIALGSWFAAATPIALVAVLPAAPAVVAAWNLAHTVVILKVEDEMAALGTEHTNRDYWRTLRREHLGTINVHAASRVRLAGLWFVQLRVAGRMYGLDYFGPLQVNSYGSQVNFGGGMPVRVADAVAEAIRCKARAAAAGA